MNPQTWAFRLQSALAYTAAARSRYFLHSPFFYDFYEKVLRANFYGQDLVELNPVEALRNQLRGATRPIARLGRLPDGRIYQLPPQPIRRIVRRESCPRSVGQFLFRFCRHYRPARVLELGVNLGLAALYLQAGHRDMHYTGIEGNPELVHLARRHLQQQGCNGQVVETAFGDFLNSQPPEPIYDLIYLDGDHRGDALISYSRRLLPLLRPGGCLLIDDIRWNRDMNRAWRLCRELSAVTVSIELLRVGLLFVGREQAREHIVLWSPQGV